MPLKGRGRDPPCTLLGYVPLPLSLTNRSKRCFKLPESRIHKVPGFPLFHDRPGQPRPPPVQELEVLLPVPQPVRKHHRDLVDYRVESLALPAEKDTVDNYLVLQFELHQLERISLIDRARKYVEKLSLHRSPENFDALKSLGEPGQKS